MRLETPNVSCFAPPRNYGPNPGQSGERGLAQLRTTSPYIVCTRDLGQHWVGNPCYTNGFFGPLRAQPPSGFLETAGAQKITPKMHPGAAGSPALPRSSMPRVQTYDHTFPSSPPPDRYKPSIISKTIPAESPNQDEANAPIFKGVDLLKAKLHFHPPAVMRRRDSGPPAASTTGSYLAGRALYDQIPPAGSRYHHERCALYDQTSRE